MAEYFYSLVHGVSASVNKSFYCMDYMTFYTNCYILLFMNLSKMYIISEIFECYIFNLIYSI